MQKKLVSLPKSVWEELRKRSHYVSKGDFSAKFFARKLLHFSFVKDITSEARKLLFIYLLREMFEFDSTICRGFAEIAYNEKDRNLLQNIAERMDDISDQEAMNAVMGSGAEEFAEPVESHA